MGLFSAFYGNEDKKNKSYIKNLLEVAIADGILDESELELVISIASNFDISKEEVIEIKDNPSTIQFTPPSSYSAKVKLLEDLVKIMIADKEIDEKEVKICKDLAIKLDIAPVIVDDLINNYIENN